MAEHDVAADSIHGRLVLAILASAYSLGVDMRACAAAAGIDLPALASDPDASVPAERVLALWGLLVDRSGDPLIGLAIAGQVPLGVLGFVYHSLNVSDCLRDAIARGQRYQRFITGPLRTSMREQGDEARIVISLPQYRDRMPFALEQHFVRMNLRALSSAVGGGLVPREVTFTAPWHGDVTRFGEAFGGAPVRFGEPEACLVLARADLDRPVPSSDPTLARWLDSQAERRFDALESRDVVVRTRSAIQLALGRGEPTLDAVAHVLRLSPRTVQRRLQELATSFAGEVDALRKELVLRLLSERARPTADVAFVAGYSELSAFYRAFRRWTGVTPAEWRKGGAGTTT